MNINCKLISTKTYISTFALSIFLLFTTSIFGQLISNFDDKDELNLTIQNGSVLSGVSGLAPTGSEYGNQGAAYVSNNQPNSIVSTSAQPTTSMTTFSFDLQSLGSNSSNGNDITDEVKVEVSINGGVTFTTIVTVNGNSNARWTYNGGTVASTTFLNPINIAPSGGGNRDDDGDGIESVVISEIPAGSIVVKITCDNYGAAEYWTVDNLSLDFSSGCIISNIATSNETCSGADYTFDVEFVTFNGSGIYEVIDVTNGNTVLASGTSSPISVTLQNNTSETPFDINVWDQNENTCTGTPVNISPDNCMPCEISNVEVSDASCEGLNYTFAVNFDVTNGSGNYEVIDGDEVVLGFGSSSPIMVSIPNNTNTNSIDVNVRDEDDNNCISSIGDSVTLVICPQNGINCWDLNGDGINEMSEDINGDGNYNALDCQGAEGPQGPDGSDGQDGAMGMQGPQGEPGPQGTPGSDGQDGANGMTGPQGEPGPQGTPGTDGQDGANGMTGPQGEPGPQGEIGPQGDSGPVDGNGIYSGDGTTMSNTTISITEVLKFDGDIAVSGEILGLSDERLKKDKQPILEAATLLSQLIPMSYHYDTKGFDHLNLSENKQYGLLAQQVETILPELVTEVNFADGEVYKSINYNALISILIGAINDQQNEIDVLKAQQKEIDVLKAQIKLLMEEKK